MFMYFRMGLLIVCLVTIAATSNVFTREKTGTAFIKSDSKKASFYQDTVKATINVEIHAPRILLQYKRYKECDASFEIQGVPMCQFQFDEFDNSVFDFLNLKLIKQIN